MNRKEYNKVLREYSVKYDIDPDLFKTLLPHNEIRDVAELIEILLEIKITKMPSTTLIKLFA